MKKYAALLLMFILGLMVSFAPQEVFAAPPNDNFSSPLPLTLNNGSGAVTTNNVGASKEAGEPNHAENAGGRSVWFKFTPAATRVVRINIVDINFDSLLAVYTGNSIGGLQLVGYNDDFNNACGGASTVDLMMTAGVTYYIAVDGYHVNGNTGEGNFKIALLENNVPFQDNLSGAYNLGDPLTLSIAGTNYGATREANEPEHVNSVYTGAKSVWYKWKTPVTRSFAFELSENFDSQITIYKSSVSNPTFAQLTRVAWNIDSNGDSISNYRVKFFAETTYTYFIIVAGHSQNPQATNAGNFQLKFQPSKMKYSIDLDARDDKASISVFRPSEGAWYSLTSMKNYNFNALNWGSNGDTPFAADFDGTGDSKYAVVRNENGQKIWYIRTTPAPTVIQWGTASDKPLIGDFDGDSRADLVAIRNTAQGYVWYVRQSLTGSLRTFNFGTTGDKPILGDFDGDGMTEVAVVRNTQTGLIWYILKSGSSNYNGYEAIHFGMAPDVPAVEDFDGDGKTDIAVFRPSNGTWYILQSGNGEIRAAEFGQSGDKPQPADYNGDGKADMAVFRPSDGTWYIAKPTGVPAQNFYTILWGTSIDIPVTSLTSLTQ